MKTASNFELVLAVGAYAWSVKISMSLCMLRRTSCIQGCVKISTSTVPHTAGRGNAAVKRTGLRSRRGGAKSRWDHHPLPADGLESRATRSRPTQSSLGQRLVCKHLDVGMHGASYIAYTRLREHGCKGTYDGKLCHGCTYRGGLTLRKRGTRRAEAD